MALDGIAIIIVLSHTDSFGAQDFLFRVDRYLNTNRILHQKV